MTDIETLCFYRFKQAEDTLSDAKKMVENSLSSRSITNRAYYSMFYAVLALFLKAGITPKTSKHAGIISIFDQEFVRTGRIDKRYSKILHDTFNARLKSDYKEYIELSSDDAAEFVKSAEEFLEVIRKSITG